MKTRHAGIFTFYIVSGVIFLIILLIVILSVFLTFITKGKNNNSSISIKQHTSEVSNSRKIITQSQVITADRLRKYIITEAALLGVTDNISLYYKDFNYGNNEIAIDPIRSWIPASTIKAYVLLEAFKQRRLGQINFDQSVLIKKENVVPTELETDDYPRLREGVSVTIQQLVEAMIVQSDNTAYNTLLDILDRRNINATLKDLGLTETVVGEKLNLDDDQFAIDLKIPGRQPNTTTIKDFASLFDLLYKKQIPESEEILSIFKKQKINNMIPAFLPLGTIVAHKTGDWAPIYNDGGIVYKPSDPYILAVFSNSNDPKVLAKLAMVSYYQDASYIGQDLPSSVRDITPGNQSQSRIMLAQNSEQSNVLGLSTNAKFPQITAEDLGITIQDLSIDKQDVRKIGIAHIIPGSPFYSVKLFLEKLSTLLPQPNIQKSNTYLTQSTSRLAELKAIAKSGDIEKMSYLLNQSENNLVQSINQLKSDNDKNSSLPLVKQTNDLNFATLADIAQSIPANKKEKFIDLVYQFYTQNEKEVKPVISNSLIANPAKQQPIIGTIKEINNNRIVLKFDNGSQKTVSLNSLTPIRAFNTQILDSDSTALKIGSKLAVVGITTPDGTIFPQFILRNIPKELPDKHEGVVIEINPVHNIMKIKDKNGDTINIVLNQSTIIKSKDTSVSLSGIKAGSVVTLFGESEKISTSSLSNQQLYLISPTIIPTTPVTKKFDIIVTPTTIILRLLSPTSPKTQPTSNPPAKKSENDNISIINATSISVTQNSSGKDEKKESTSQTSTSKSKKNK